MSRKTLQVIAVAYCLGVLGVGSWFWIRQIQSVIELLRIAYG